MAKNQTKEKKKKDIREILQNREHKFQKELKKEEFFEYKKFHTKIVIFTIIGMLISGAVSGLLIYYWTADDSQEIYVGLGEIYPKEFLAKVDVYNTGPKVVMGLESHYNIDDKLKGNVNFDDKTLGSDQKTLGTIDFSDLEIMSIEQCKEEILKGIAWGSEGVIRTCRRTHNLIITDISCDTCKEITIILTSGVKTINTEVECIHGKERELNCKLVNIF